MPTTSKAKVSFLLLLGVLMIAFVTMLRPFLLPILLAIVLVIICDPIYLLFFKWFGKRRYLAALPATLIVLLCVVAPLGVAIGVIISNAADISNYITIQLEAGQIAQSIDGINVWMMNKLSVISNLLPADFNFRVMLIGFLKTATKTVYQYSPKVVMATAGVVGSFLLMVIFIFVFFAEGSRTYNALISLLPMADEHKSILSREIRQVVSATFLGLIATSVAQGLLIGIGFWIAGISNPLVWGLVAVGVTLIPVIGGPLMYVPATVALLLGGKTGTSVFILAYGICIVSTVDNIIKPLIMRGKVNVHPLLLALSLIGGCIWLGPKGVIIGPLILVLMMAMFKIYQREFI